MTLKLSEGRVKSYNVALAAMQLSLCRGESGGMVQVSHVGWVVKISQSVTVPVRIYKSLAFLINLMQGNKMFAMSYILYSLAHARAPRFGF